MSVAAFLADLRRRDVRIWTDGDSLHCDAPPGVLTPELREQLRSLKADVIDFLHASQTLARQQRAIVPLQPRGAGAAVYAVPGHSGDVFCYRALARHLGDERPFFGLEPPGLDGSSEPLSRLEELAAYFAAQIRTLQQDAPCIVAGYCAGGTVSMELARQLRQGGLDVVYVALFGAPYSTWYRRRAQWRWRVRAQAERFVKHVRELAGRSPAQWGDYLRTELRDRRARQAAEAAAARDAILFRRHRVESATLAAVRAYVPVPWPGRIGIYLPFRDDVLNDGARRWKALAPEAEAHFGPPGSDGYNMLLEPHVGATAELFRQSLRRLERP